MMDQTVRIEVPKDKTEAILAAAFDVFARYGFRRTSMADIAQAANMSRPALYQHFSGKDDIARTMVAKFFEDAELNVQRALEEQGAPAEVLERAFRAKGGASVKVMMESPHGQELMDAGISVAADLSAQGMGRLRALFAAWMSREAASGRIVLDDDAGDMAASMLAALEAGKGETYEDYEAHLVRIARVFGRALAATPK